MSSEPLLNGLPMHREAHLLLVTTGAKHPNSETGVLPVGFITVGPGISSHGLLFSQLGAQMQSNPKCSFVLLTAAEAINLKACLRLLIRKATNPAGGDVDDEELQIFQVSRLKTNMLVLGC